jgi:hypothetical protein
MEPNIVTARGAGASFSFADQGGVEHAVLGGVIVARLPILQEHHDANGPNRGQVLPTMQEFRPANGRA